MGSQKIDGIGLEKEGAKVKTDEKISPEEIKAAEKAKTNAELQEYYKKQKELYTEGLKTIQESEAKYGDPMSNEAKLAELNFEYGKFSGELNELKKQFSEIPEAHKRERNFVAYQIINIESKLAQLASLKSELEAK